MERYMSHVKSKESDPRKKVAFQNSSVSEGPSSNRLAMNVSQRSVYQTLEPRSVCIEPEFSEPIEEFINCDFQNSSTYFQTHCFPQNISGKQGINRSCRPQPYNVPPKNSVNYKIDAIYNKDICKNQYTVYSPNLNIHKTPEIHGHITAQQYSGSLPSGSGNPHVLTVHNIPSFSNYQNIHFPFYLHNQGNQENPESILFPQVAPKQASDHPTKVCTLTVKQQAKINTSGSHYSPNNHNFHHVAAHTVNQNNEHFPTQNTQIERYDTQNKFELLHKRKSDIDKKKTETVTEAKKSSWLSQVNVKPRLQHFIGSVEQVIRWHQMTKKLHLDAFYETTGTFESMRNGKYFSQRILFIRGGTVYSQTVLQAVFYAIDRELPEFQRGQLITCVGRMIGGNKLHIFDAWETTKDLQNGIKRVSSLCQRILQEKHHIITDMVWTVKRLLYS